MKIKKIKNTVKLWLSANDTYKWAHKTGACWPCSLLSGKQLFAEFDDGDLVDFTVNDNTTSTIARNIPSNEFNAITSDYLKQS